MIGGVSCAKPPSELGEPRREIGGQPLVLLIAGRGLDIHDDIDRGIVIAPAVSNDLSDDALDPIPGHRVAELLRRRDSQARTRGRSRQSEQHEVLPVHALTALIDFEEKPSGAEAGCSREGPIGASAIRARDACAPSRGAGIGQDAPPWCSCAHGTRESSFADGCSVETCASWQPIPHSARRKPSV
jgi:hypothetical protein